MWLSKSFKALGGWRLHVHITKRNWWYIWIAFMVYYMTIASCYLLLGVLWLICLPFMLIYRSVNKNNHLQPAYAVPTGQRPTPQRSVNPPPRPQRTVNPSPTPQRSVNPQPTRTGQPVTPTRTVVQVDPRTGEVLGAVAMKKKMNPLLKLVIIVFGASAVLMILIGSCSDSEKSDIVVSSDSVEVNRSAITGAADNAAEPETAYIAEITDAPETESPQTEAPQTEAPVTEPPQTAPPETKAPELVPVGYLTYVNSISEAKYVLNTATMKFHSPRCNDVKKIDPSNIAYVYSHRDDVIAAGYDRCGHCKP